jgi:hypothetical protein
MFAARRITEIIADMDSDDPDLSEDLMTLRKRLRCQLASGTPWKERDSLDAIAILDQPSWAVLLGLLDECPTVPRLADRRTHRSRQLRVNSEFEFIAERSQVEWVHRFMEGLPDRLV